jgi:hypothetical protein
VRAAWTGWVDAAAPLAARCVRRAGWAGFSGSAQHARASPLRTPLPLHLHWRASTAGGNGTV